MAPKRRLPRPLARVVDSIKFRVVLAASLLFTMLAMFGSLVFVRSWVSEIENRRPLELRTAVSEICGHLAEGSDPTVLTLEANRPISYRIEEIGGTAQEGTLQVGADSTAAVEAPSACIAPDRWRVARASGPSDGTVQLAVTRHVTLEGFQYRITVASTLMAAPDDISTVVHATRIGIPALVLGVAVLLWLVTAQALRPVRDISRRAAEISLGTISTRLPDPVHDDELAELTRHLNGMLSRLEKASQRQQQFVSDASHELRSPVATILAMSERSALTPDELARVHSEAARLSGLIDALIELARVQEGGGYVTHEQVDVADMLLEDAERVLVQAERRHVTVDTTAVSPLEISASRPALAGIVRNLVDNAVRHAEREVAVSCRQVGPLAVLEVHDDGPGIPEDQREAVFERFVRLDPGRSRGKGGTGLGLALVRDLVTAHGGDVKADISPLGGACFRVTLPVARPS